MLYEKRAFPLLHPAYLPFPLLHPVYLPFPLFQLVYIPFPLLHPVYLPFPLLHPLYLPFPLLHPVYIPFPLLQPLYLQFPLLLPVYLPFPLLHPVYLPFPLLHPVYLPYIFESNPHSFYSFRGLKNQMRIRIACQLDSRSWAGFWKNDRAAVRAVRTIQYNNLLFSLLFVIIIIVFLHGLGRLTCSGIDALPSFPGASTIPSSSVFVGEGTLLYI